MYILVLLLVLNGQVIEERQGARFNNYIDCTNTGAKLMATKPKNVEAVFACREDLGKRVM